MSGCQVVYEQLLRNCNAVARALEVGCQSIAIQLPGHCYKVAKAFCVVAGALLGTWWIDMGGFQGFAIQLLGHCG